MRSIFAKLFALFSFMILTLEVVGYYSPHWFPDLYDYSPDTLQEIEMEGDPAFQRLISWDILSPVTGWKQPDKPNMLERKNCAGIEQRYTQDEYGVRTYTGYDRAKAEVLLVGDLFVLGDEVSDNETIAARIFQQTGIVSANLGTEGFSPVQAFFRARAQRQEFPESHG